MIILLYRPLRHNDRTLMLGLGLVVMGLVINRWNITLSGLVAPPDWSPGVLGNVVAATYAPTVIEVLVALGILDFGVLGFSLGVRYLPIYNPPCAHETGD